MSDAPYQIPRYPRGKWLWSFSLEAETWNGGFPTMEGALQDAIRQFEDLFVTNSKDPLEVFVCHGRPLPKAECDEWGLDWPWYNVEPKEALRVLIPRQQ